MYDWRNKLGIRVCEIASAVVYGGFQGEKTAVKKNVEKTKKGKERELGSSKRVGK